MKKKIFIAAIALSAVCVMGAVGNYFVDYALKRANSQDIDDRPAASKRLASSDIKIAAEPKSAIRREDWTIISADGLHLRAGCFYPDGKPPQRMAILVHGYGRDQRYSWDYAEEYLRRGYAVLTPDLRAAGTSEGTYVTMGAKESEDVRLWVEEILRRYPEATIVLHGVSMGAATVMIAAAEVPDNVVAVIEDCGYTNAYDMFTAQLGKMFGLPEYPVMPCADVVCRLKTGAFISAPTAISAVAATRTPMLFIHGDADGLVPCSMMEELYIACSAPLKDSWLVSGADHARAKFNNPAAYFDKIFAFIDRAEKSKGRL